MADDLEDTIRENAEGPAKAAGDSGSMEQHKLPDQIAADRYRRTRREVFPILSRIQNIGYELGENGRTPEWYRANHRTPWVSIGLQRETSEWRYV